MLKIFEDYYNIPSFSTTNICVRSNIRCILQLKQDCNGLNAEADMRRQLSSFIRDLQTCKRMLLFHYFFLNTVIHRDIIYVNR